MAMATKKIADVDVQVGAGSAEPEKASARKPAAKQGVAQSVVTADGRERVRVNDDTLFEMDENVYVQVMAGDFVPVELIERGRPAKARRDFIR
jgi:hypothetical protein